MGRRESDPLALLIAPPKNESEQDKEARLRAEQEAKRISNEIDDQLKLEKAELKKKRKNTIKVLLLGQSESGKSATLKNFQIAYAKQEWTKERASWRAVIQLNLLRNVNEIIHHLSSQSPTSQPTRSHPAYHHLYHHRDYDDDDELDDHHPNSVVDLTEQFKLLKLRLAPLRRVQRDLEIRLGAATTEAYEPGFGPAAFETRHPRNARRPTEFTVHSRNGWKSALDKVRPGSSSSSRKGDQRRITTRENEDLTEVIASCREDMIALWDDPFVRELLSRTNFTVEDKPGFFLGDAARIAVRDYQPTDRDIIRARLRTLGVQEYRFAMKDKLSEASQEWILYDVGGARTSRASWSPYFDDLNAVIFLAPISCFDEALTEDPRVNRLQDSFLLWEALCANKLLAGAHIVLFLNKCDLLDLKLKRGVSIRRSVPTYGERKNELGTAAKYFQQHFRDIASQHSPVERDVHIHLTSVIDTHATAVTLSVVQDSIITNHLRKADLL